METINTTNQFKDIYELLRFHKAIVKSKADLWRKVGVIQTFAVVESTDLVQQRLIFIEKFLEVFGIKPNEHQEIDSESVVKDIITIGNERREILLQHKEWQEIKRQEELISSLKKKIRARKGRKR